MSEVHDYSSIVLKPFEKLNRLPSLLFILGGLSILAITGLSAKVNFYFLRDIWLTRFQNIQFAIGGKQVIDTVRLAYLIATVLFLPLLIWSVKIGVQTAFEYIRRGLYYLRKPEYLGSIPKNLSGAPASKTEKVYQAIKSRTLSIYKPLEEHSPKDKKMGRNLTILFGRRTGMVAPQERVVVMNLSQRIGGHTKGLLISCATLSGLAWLLPRLQGTAIQQAFETWLANPLFRFLFGEPSLKWIVIASVAAAALFFTILVIEVAAIYSLLPRKKVTTECHEESIFYEGFGHPAMILHRLPDWYTSLRLEKKFPNRLYEKDIQFRKDHPVSDAGLFNGSIFIEQQPRYTSSPNRIVASLLLVLGWLLIIAGFSLIFLPNNHYAALKNGVQLWERLLGAPLLIPALALLFRFCINNGLHFIDQAYHLFDTFNYRSVGLLVEIEGYMSQADIKIGKALDDSISGGRKFVSSDFNVDLYTAELLSQSKGIRGERYLTAFRQNEESSEWLAVARKEISAMHAKGVKAIPLDMSKPVIGLMDSNLALAGLKARQRISKKDEIVVNEDEAQSEMLPAGTEEDD